MEQPVLPPLAFLDVETTGLSTAHNDRICEIAILRWQENAGISWQSLINPCRVISPGASAINGITNRMVAKAPLFADVADKILELVDGATLVCHNAPFDLSFLSAEMENCGRVLPNIPAIDTLRIARQHFDFPSNSLGNIAAYLSIAVTEQHRAMADVETTHKVFMHFWEELNRRGEVRIDQLLVSHVWFPRKRENEAAALPPVLEEAIRGGRNIRLSYLSHTGEETKRTVTPLKVVSQVEYPCLEAYCHLRNEKRMFRLDRIVRVKVVTS